MPEQRIEAFPACDQIKFYRGSFCHDYGTGAAATRCVRLPDGRRVVLPGPGDVHAAHDIHGVRGTSIYAVEDGVITRRNLREDPDGGGFVIKLQPADGARIYYYAHLDEPGFFDEGDEVVAGEEIGVMGDSGNARGTGVHLHLQALEWIDQIGRFGPVDVYDELAAVLTPAEASAVRTLQGGVVGCRIAPAGRGVTEDGGEEGPGVGGWLAAGAILVGAGYLFLRRR